MVATLAKARGFTSSALAAEIGVHRNRLADKIAGRVPFTETDILKLAEVLDIPPGRLFEDPLELLGVGPVRNSDHGLLPSRFGQPRRSEHVSGKVVICRAHRFSVRAGARVVR